MAQHGTAWDGSCSVLPSLAKPPTQHILQPNQCTPRVVPFTPIPLPRYEKAQKPLSSYEADINEFLNKQDEVAHEETTTNVKFLFIDCGPLKQALSSHCDLWRTKLTGLLNRQAGAELRALHDTFKSGLEALAAAPGDLAALAEAVALHTKLADDRARIQARFEPLRWVLLARTPHVRAPGV